VAVDVGADGHDEFFQVAENPAAEPILSEVTKEAFHHIEPGRAGESEVQMKARVSHQPALDLKEAANVQQYFDPTETQSRRLR